MNLFPLIDSRQLANTNARPGVVLLDFLQAS
jgi:hypothetical protein